MLNNSLIECIGDLEKAMGGDVIWQEGCEQSPRADYRDFCLCGVDISATAKALGMEWENDGWCYVFTPTKGGRDGQA